MRHDATFLSSDVTEFTRWQRTPLSVSGINETFIGPRYQLDIMEAGPTSLYLGCAALLIAAVLLRPPPRIRAALFTAMILTTTAGGQSQRTERVATEIVAAVD